MQEGESVRRDFLKSAGTTALGVFVVAPLLNAIASTAPALAQATDRQAQIESGVIAGAASGDVASFIGGINNWYDIKLPMSRTGEFSCVISFTTELRESSRCCLH